MQDNLSQKPESNTDQPVFRIKHRFTGKILFELQCKSLKICIEAALKSGADLSGADLSGADLYGANLSRADLSGADLSGADLYGADLYGAKLSGAKLSGAYLSGANLYGADLSGADLSGADLSGADLYGANLYGANGEKTTIKYTPLQISGLRWPIIIFDKDMKIGYEYHSISNWWSFDDDRISKMESDALDFWKANKPMLQALCAANGRE